MKDIEKGFIDRIIAEGNARIKRDREERERQARVIVDFASHKLTQRKFARDVQRILRDGVVEPKGPARLHDITDYQ